MSTTISGTNGVTFPDSTSMQTGQQACKAWVNFNGTGTVAIRGSYNVSSITDDGNGNYAVNFTTAMPDINYCAVAAAGIYGNVTAVKTGNVVTTGYVTVDAFIPGGTWTDAGYVAVAVFR